MIILTCFPVVKLRKSLFKRNRNWKLTVFIIINVYNLYEFILDQAMLLRVPLWIVQCHLCTDGAQLIVSYLILMVKEIWDWNFWIVINPLRKHLSVSYVVLGNRFKLLMFIVHWIYVFQALTVIVFFKYIINLFANEYTMYIHIFWWCGLTRIVHFLDYTDMAGHFS